MGNTIIIVIILLVTVYSVWKGWQQLRGPDDEQRDTQNDKKDG